MYHKDLQININVYTTTMESESKKDSRRPRRMESYKQKWNAI